MRLSACALFVAPRLCSTKTRRNKKSADNICRCQGGSSARGILLLVGRRKFCCVSVDRDKVSVVGVLSSAFVVVRTPTKEGRRKRHFRRRSRVGVPTPMNADNEVSVERSGGGRLRYGVSVARLRTRAFCRWRVASREGRSGGGRFRDGGF
jgi:hypothetical protein